MSETTRPTTRAALACLVCDAHVVAKKLSSPHPEAPDLIEVPFGWWVGIVLPDAFPRELDTARRAALSAVCSSRCAQTLLKE